jgi:hypothetical protein
MRNSKPERLRRLQIDYELELGRLLDRDVGGLRPLTALPHRLVTAPTHSEAAP